MIIFDSNQSNKWSGKGLSINKSNIIAYKNANFKHDVDLSKGKYTLKILAQNRTGSGNFNIKIITDKNVTLFSEKISANKNWTEKSFEFEISKNYGMGSVVIYRDTVTYGSIEIGRLILDREIIAQAPVNKINKKQNIENIEINKEQHKKKIGFIIPYSIYGGAEVFLETLISNIDSELFQAHLIYFKQNPLENIINNNEIIHKKTVSEENLINYVRSQNFDFIVYYNSLMIYKICQKIVQDNRRIKLIEILHSNFLWGDAVAGLKERNNLKVLFTTSPNLGNDIIGNFKKIHLPVPIDTLKFSENHFSNDNLSLALPTGKKIIGTVARLSKEKNIDYVLDIAKELQKYNFVIFGEGKEEHRLKLRINQEQISNVHLMGFKKDIFRYYKYFSGLLLTSVMEGTPISILEAMSSGVPVFTTNVGEISSILTNNETGFFLTGNLKKDSLIIENNLLNQDVIFKARKYIEETHSKENVEKIFKNNIFDIQAAFIKRDGIKILEGEYI